MSIQTIACDPCQDAKTGSLRDPIARQLDKRDDGFRATKGLWFFKDLETP